MADSNILANFLLLDNQVQAHSVLLQAVEQVKRSGELLVGNGTESTTLDPSTGINGQALIRNTSVLEGVSWASTIGLAPSGVVANTYVNGTFTVDINGIVTSAVQGNINNITPTTVKGDLLVEDGTEVVAVPVGINGSFLTADSGQSSGVGWSTLTFGDITPTGAKGDLIVEDNVGPVALSIGTVGQQLEVDLGEPTGMKWANKQTLPTLEDLTPTTTKGDIIVHDSVGAMVALPVGVANDGDVLTINSSVTATSLEWAAPSGGGGGGPLNVVENIHVGSNVTVNITLGAYAHNTMFVINPNGNFGTGFYYNLPPITAAEQGVIYRFSVYQEDFGAIFWQIVPAGSDLLEFASYVDSNTPQLSFFQSTNFDPASFNIAAGSSASGAYGAGISIMALFPASGTPKWIGIDTARGVQGAAGYTSLG